MMETRQSKGQSLIEFALILPILILVVMVIVDLGRVVYYLSALNNAAREGARYGVIHPTDVVGIQQAARRLTAGISPTVTPTTGDFNGDGDLDIRVVVTYTFTPATPILGRLFGPATNTIPLSSRAIMRIEDQ